ncbi:MAG: SDR family oxidoreductase [Acidobacteriota bacterium]
MKVLLSGHRGYIGAVAAPLLAEAGHEVVGLDTDLFAGCDFGDATAPVPSIRKDMRELKPSDLHGFDAVVHLAALSNDPLGNLNSKVTYDINYHASVHLAEAAKAAGVRRFVFSSSCSTYGKAGDDFLDETADLSPVTAYAESKVWVEKALGELASDDFSPTNMRNATAYGVSPRLRRDIVLNDLVASAFTTGLVYVKSDGTPWRPIVHIRDIIAAMITVLAAPLESVHNQTFNVGSTEENYRVRDLAEIVAETVPGCRVEYAPGGGPDTRCYRVSCDKIVKALGFRTQWTARMGAQELYDSYRGSLDHKSDLENGTYVRIQRIQELMKAGALDGELRWTQQMAETTGVSN